MLLDITLVDANSFQNPRNVGKFDAEEVKAGNVGTGLVGAPVCGDVMKLQVYSAFSSFNNFNTYFLD